MTDEGLEALGQLRQLRWLELVNTRVTDAGLMHLKGCAGLQRVKLHGTKVTPAGVKELRDALPGLQLAR